MVKNVFYKRQPDDVGIYLILVWSHSNTHARQAALCKKRICMYIVIQYKQHSPCTVFVYLLSIINKSQNNLVQFCTITYKGHGGVYVRIESCSI